ncbi:hypothetical protein PR048_018273 [Dryococelus australis]|uniref:Uncharacterized protein n=1 Tax=Dryococelus australis TaxID=614101 RepID=A0ABQ9HBT8_9NEOP|nr:hypothetical protein PR048_018273 [Dryococelus australis]
MSLVGGFSQGSPVSLPLHSGTAPYSPRSTLIGSQDLDVKEPSKSSHYTYRDVYILTDNTISTKHAAQQGHAVKLPVKGKVNVLNAYDCEAGSAARSWVKNAPTLCRFQCAYTRLSHKVGVRFTHDLVALAGPRAAQSRGWRLVRLLASHQGEPGYIPGGLAPALSHVGLVPNDAAGRRVFSGIPHFPPALHSYIGPYSPRFTIISSQDRNDNSRPNLPTSPITFALYFFSLFIVSRILLAADINYYRISPCIELHSRPDTGSRTRGTPVGVPYVGYDIEPWLLLRRRKAGCFAEWQRRQDICKWVSRRYRATEDVSQSGARTTRSSIPRQMSQAVSMQPDDSDMKRLQAEIGKLKEETANLSIRKQNPLPQERCQIDMQQGRQRVLTNLAYEGVVCNSPMDKQKRSRDVSRAMFNKVVPTQPYTKIASYNTCSNGIVTTSVRPPPNTYQEVPHSNSKCSAPSTHDRMQRREKHSPVNREVEQRVQRIAKSRRPPPRAHARITALHAEVPVKLRGSQFIGPVSKAQNKCALCCYVGRKAYNCTLFPNQKFEFRTDVGTFFRNLKNTFGTGHTKVHVSANARQHRVNQEVKLGGHKDGNNETHSRNLLTRTSSQTQG